MARALVAACFLSGRLAPFGWTQNQTNAVKTSIVVHEVGHQFGLPDDEVSQHTHVMCTYTTDVPGERDQYLDPIVFLESHVYTIRTTLFP